MKKRSISMLLVFVLSISLLAACGGNSKLDEISKKPVGDILTEAMQKQTEMESNHAVVEINAKVDLPQEMMADPQVAMIAPYLKGTKITINQNSLLKENLISATMTLEAADGSMPAQSANLYVLSDTKMAIQSPLLPKIIVIDTEEAAELAEAQGQTLAVTPSFNMSSEENKKMIKLVQNLYAEAFKGIEPTSRENKEIEFSDGKKEVHMISYSYKSNDEIMDLFDKIIKNLLESETLYDLLASEEFESISSAMSGQIDPMAAEVSFKEQYPTKEDFTKAQKDALEQYETMKPMMKEQLDAVINIKDLSITMGVDENGYVTYSDFNIDGTAVVEMLQMDIPLTINMNSKMDKINAVKKEDITTIELTDDNSMSFTEFLQGGFGM